MMLCQLQPEYSTCAHSDNEINWENAAQQLPQPLLLSCPNWIKSMKNLQNPTDTSNIHPHQLTAVNPSNYQQTAFDIISHHYSLYINGHNPNPLHMIILGTAGTGKSFLIENLANLLRHHCLLTATTGMVAFNIHGITLHSALQLPVHTTFIDLQGQSLASLQQRLTGKYYLFIDEVSMLGQRTIAQVDSRLRQASSQHQTPFGGFSLFLIGDFGQLPPVGDRPLYAPEGAGSHGYTMYQLFTKVVILQQVMRQLGSDADTTAFRQLLMRLRNGQVTD